MPKIKLEELLKNQIRDYRSITLISETGNNSPGAEYKVSCPVYNDELKPNKTLYDYLLFDDNLSNIANNCSFLPDFMKEIYESYLLNIIEELLKIYIYENDKIIEAVLAAKAAASAEQERVEKTQQKSYVNTDETNRRNTAKLFE